MKHRYILVNGTGSGSGGSVTLSDWSFPAGTDYGTGAEDYTYNNATFYGTPPSNIKVSGSLVAASEGAGATNVTCTGAVSELTIQATNVDSNPGTCIVAFTGTIGTISIDAQDGSYAEVGMDGIDCAITVLSITNGSIFLLESPNVVDNISIGSVGASGAWSATFNGPFSAASTTNILVYFRNASVTGGTIVIGGASAPPNTATEIDELTITNPTDGDTFSVASQAGASLQVVFNALLNLAGSFAAGSNPYVVTIGIMDNPTVDEIASTLAGFVIDSGIADSAVASGPVITITQGLFAAWPLAYLDGVGSSASFSNIQDGLDLVSQLTAMGNSVTVNS